MTYRTKRQGCERQFRKGKKHSQRETQSSTERSQSYNMQRYQLKAVQAGIEEKKTRYYRIDEEDEEKKGLIRQDRGGQYGSVGDRRGEEDDKRRTMRPALGLCLFDLKFELLRGDHRKCKSSAAECKFQHWKNRDKAAWPTEKIMEAVKRSRILNHSEKDELESKVKQLM